LFRKTSAAPSYNPTDQASGFVEMVKQSIVDAQHWFAVEVRPKMERSVAQLLRWKGYEEFVPVQPVLQKWSDRTKKIEQPLFSGYVFCRFDPLRRLPILVTPGVKSIVSFSNIPCPIPDEEINNIQTVMNSGAAIHKWAFMDVGQNIRVDEGPLRGLEGVIVSVKNELRLIVSISLLRRSVAVELRPEWISRIAGTTNQPARSARFSHCPIPSGSSVK
jgi:transcription antitermination factor NusG